MRTNTAATLMLALGALAGCSTVTKSMETSEAPAKSANKDETKRESLERKLAIARLRMDHAKMEQEKAAMSSKKAVEFAQEELEMAQAVLAQFEELDSPNRRARSELDLKRAEDRTAEAAEELAQLKIMYDEQDLQDMTAEFVISRGKRNAERAELSLAIQRREFESLTAHEMPRTLRQHQLSVARKASALQKAKADAEASRVSSEISVLKANSDLLEVEQELEKIDGGAES